LSADPGYGRVARWLDSGLLAFRGGICVAKGAWYGGLWAGLWPACGLFVAC